MLNIVHLIGRLGKNVELAHTPNGTAVGKFSMATEESYKDQTGSWQKKTEWHNIVCFNRIAESCANFISKGSLVYVTGNLSTRTYEKNGETRYFTEVKANKVLFLTKQEDATESYIPSNETVPATETFDMDDMPF